MRSRTANWFECTVRYERQMEDGMTKKVPELYVVDALSFGEAEEAITREMYKAKLSFITIDEKTEKEKRSTVTYLVQASTFNGAVKNIEQVMGGTMIDYVIANISETKIMDVYEHEASVKQDKANDVPEYEQ